MKIVYMKAEYILDKKPESVSELKDQLKLLLKLHPTRQAFKTETGKRVKHDKHLAEPVETLYVKDLGPQVDYQLVFIVEYFAPFAVCALTQTWVGPVQNWGALVAYMLHFLKRLLETVFVHQFSTQTMPLTNLFKNTLYYGMFALAISWETLHRPAAKATTPFWVLWILCEYLNLHTHINLRIHGTAYKNFVSKLNPKAKRTLPSSFGFNLVVCPNYLFEVLGWCMFTAATRSWSSLAFTVVGACQMAVWAKKKQKQYLKNEIPVPKYVMLPGVV